MKLRRRWILFWNWAALLVVLLLLRRYDPPFDGSSLFPVRSGVAERENAFPLYMDLGARLRANNLDATGIVPLETNFQDPSRGWLFARDLVNSNRPFLAEFDSILKIPFCRFPEFTNFGADETNAVRLASLDGFLELASASSLQAGDAEQATRHALRQSAFARHLLQRPEGMGVFFLATSVQAKACSTFRRIASDPGASVEILRTLPRDAREGFSTPDAFRCALQCQYEIQSNIMDILYKENGGAGFISMYFGLSRVSFLSESLKGELLYRHHRSKRMLHEWVSVALEASRHERVVPDAARLFNFRRSDPRFGNHGPRFFLRANYIGENYVESSNNFDLDFYFWQVHLAQQRLTRAFLALHLHRKVRGAFPSTLSALCPEFLPEVPSDPFDGSPVHFDPDIPAVFSSWPLDGHGRPSCASNLADLPSLTKPDRDNGSTVLFLFPPPDPTPQSGGEIRKSRRPR